jgi:hypothetical protein
MRLSVQKEKGIWRISDLDETHVNLIRQAAEDASISDSPEARARLFPSPVPKKDQLREGEFLEDWSDFVTDDLETQFASDVGIVLADLDTAVPQRSTKETGERRLRLDVPIEHATPWFSALNQARLMLDQKFKLHPEGDGDFEPVLKEEQGSGLDMHERLEVYMRYEFYAALQEWLVRHVME